ncbi:MAG TPA: DUF4142 domain-containing protein [Gemmatimonadaceae bacterium]|nr:DUF4142 domain-containing protein [Gemmatimonadaceae bacterium]
MYMTTSRYASLALAIAVGTTLGACNGRRGSSAVSETAGGTVSSTPAGDTGTAGAATGATTGAATGADTTHGAAGGEVGNASSAFKGLSDANYAALVSQANKGDVQAGKLMETKATNPRVRAFAKQMVTDHNALEKQTQALAHKLNLTPQPPSNDPVQQMGSSEMQTLKSTSKGAALDSTYIDQEVAFHKAALDLLNAIQSDAGNAQLKALANKAQPVIQMHLTNAESIQKELQSGSKSGQ